MQSREIEKKKKSSSGSATAEYDAAAAAAEESLFLNFASSTTAHGFSKLAEAKNFVRKVIWAVLLFAAFIGVVLILATRYCISVFPDM